ncbi:hypothetical protein [Flagellimonas pacifica]|uniref:Uncharacterized protein n=1 Tax=Flagellimonas pacifica TaxID=1247520 RepID=A0A285MWU1_9FLAO|nr:hypothetical protein [Allomuricauda parva]SNZ01669.1 hypothetical protein SAMN06265377_3511 [Allomuricauda parva]
MENTLKSFDDNKDIVIAKIQKLVADNLDLEAFDIDQIRFSVKATRNCKWVRKKYTRNGKVYIKYECVRD